jgi:ATP-dependent exoDNAse (exonuclease V) beta subunit
MQLMTSLQRIIQRNLTEANCALLSRTASILDNALRGGDADFILEKVGIRYHHVLMDEFQDTSKLQWSVIEKLLRELVAGEGNSPLIVGDIKQSIYRWRNGDWHIMDSLTSEGVSALTKDRLNPLFTSLQQNFRSSEEVVRFNLSFFQYVMDHYADFHQGLREDEPALIRRIYDEHFRPELIDQFYQSKKKKGGYVRLSALETKDECLTQLFDTMEQLLPDIDPSQMMVLVRGAADAECVARKLSEDGLWAVAVETVR